MNHSIKKYLIINLLGSVTLVVVFAAIPNYYFAQKNIQRHLDVFLSQTALNIHAFLNDRETRIKTIQGKINRIPAIIKLMFSQAEDEEIAYEAFQFQVWDQRGHLLLHSLNAPSQALSDGSAGYSTISIDKTHWRVFTLPNKFSKLTVLVAESLSHRAQLSQKLVHNYFFIILIVYPVLGLLIWMSIGQALLSLKRVATEVSQRAPGFLKAFEIKSVAIEIKPLVDELNDLFLRLQEALEREKRFSQNAAHELKTPLAGLKTQAQVAMKATDPKEQAKTLNQLIKAVERCTRIVEQLLSLSRLAPDSATGLSEIARIDLTHIVRETMIALVPEALNKNVEVELIEQSQNDLFISGNATMIGMLVRNLIDNAIRYTPDNGMVHVYLASKEEAILLRIQDTGPGIPPPLRSLVFERFYRILGNQSSGTGLGLAIVKQIVQLHQAHILLDSGKDDRGCVVEITFPKKMKSQRVSKNV